MAVILHFPVRLPVLLALAALAMACGGGGGAPAASTAPAVGVGTPPPPPPPPLPPAPPAPPPPVLDVTEVVIGLQSPWGAAFLPDGSMLLTERVGRLRMVRDGQLVAAPISGMPPVFSEGQGGLLDVAVHPDFARNGLVYLTLSRGTASENRTAVIRGRLNGMALENVQTVFEARPGKSGSAHFGSRLLFLPDASLLVTIGDGGGWAAEAQNKANAFGKIVRITDTGLPAPGNPFLTDAAAMPELFTYGHRNPQGIVRDPVTGNVFALEHGPLGGDELNLIRSGANYGWPVVTHGLEYSGAPISNLTEAPGIDPPLAHWSPSIAPGGAVFYTSTMFPAWRGDIILANLAAQNLRRIDMEGATVLGQEVLLAGLGLRFRQLVQAPDGSLFALTDSQQGKLLRISQRP